MTRRGDEQGGYWSFTHSIIVHKEGQRNMNADALSRRPETSDMKVAEDGGPTSLHVSADHAAVDMPRSSVVTDSADTAAPENPQHRPGGMSPFSALSHSSADVRAMQDADPNIGTVLDWVSQSHRPPRWKLKGSSLWLRRLWTEFHSLSSMACYAAQ